MPRMPEPQRPQAEHVPDEPGPLLRLALLVVSAGLAWAIAVAFVAWLAGLVL